MYISVIIPVYNAEKTIKSTIESVFNQTYAEIIEIIIVNDGSTDDSKKIVTKSILSNKTSRIIKLIDKENGGVSSARNRGIEEASGEYIAFLDSDDEWHPKKLEIVMNLMKKNKINFLGHHYTLENNFNKTFTEKKPKEVSFYHLLLKSSIPTPSVVIKREICGHFNEKMTHTEDHDLWLKTALKNRIFYVELALVKLGRPKLAKGGLSSNKWSMRKGEIEMYLNIVMLKKSLIPFLPFLIIFSLTKHFKNYLKDVFAED